MSNETPEYYSIFSSVFETALLAELEAKSMLMKVSGGETIMRPEIFSLAYNEKYGSLG